MDDVISIYKDDGTWDSRAFDKQLETGCYIAPLRLEAGTPGVFLETEIAIKDNRFTYKLKNANTDANAPKVWRYQHFNSYQPYMRKRATISAALQKAVFFASDEEQLVRSAVIKLREFIANGYPFPVIKYCTDRMGARHVPRIWRRVLEICYK